MAVTGLSIAFLLDLNSAPQERSHMLYCKLGQKPTAKVVIGLGAGYCCFAIDCQINFYILMFLPIDLCLGKRTFFLQWDKVNIVTHNWLKH